MVTNNSYINIEDPCTHCNVSHAHVHLNSEDSPSDSHNSEVTDECREPKVKCDDLFVNIQLLFIARVES